LGTEYDGKVVVGKVDVMQTKNAAKTVWETSNSIDFHNGEVVGKQVEI
jgi:hypothetical protein